MNVMIMPDEQAEQGEDQAVAEVLDVVAEAHRDHRLFFGEEILVGTHGVGPPSPVGEESRRAGAAMRVGEETRVASASPEAEALASGAAGGLAGTAGPAGAFLDLRS